MTESLAVRLLDIWFQNDSIPVTAVDAPVWGPVHAALDRAIRDQLFEEGSRPAGYWRQLGPRQRQGEKEGWDSA